MPELSAALRQFFEHDDFRPGQREIIARILDGGRVLGILPTSGGKSLTYQLPAVMLDGLTLVVSPLLALMKDQVDALKARDFRAARLDSTLPKAEQAAVLEAAVSGEIDLLYLSPERLAHRGTLRQLQTARIALLAIDEVHCYTEWGHSFRPDYLRLPKLARQLKPRSLLCLSATITPAATKEIRRAFRIKAAETVTTSFDRPNLRYQITPLEPEERFPTLVRRLSDPASLPAIVYVIRQETAVDLSGQLGQAGIAARCYHAGMDAAGREHVQQAFLSGEVPVVVATIAFGMGVNKTDVRRVIHYNLPKSPEGWLQESGRAGRDGAEAIAEVFACAADVPVLENFATAWLPTERTLERLVETILRGGEISLFDLSATFDVRRETLEHLLVRLELAGHLRVIGRTWKRARVSPLRLDRRPIESLPRSLRKEAAALLETSGALDLSALAERGFPLPRLHRVLDEWEQAGEMQVKRWHPLVEIRPSPSAPAPASLAADYRASLAGQADAAMLRLQAVLKILTSRGCVTRGLLTHFGERRSSRCGRCSNCEGKFPPRALPGAAPAAPSAVELEAIAAVVKEKRGALATPSQLGRFLCGIHSPAASRKNLHRHPSFGLLSRLPFSTAAAYAKAILGR